jgi:hypothetical protein
VVRLRTPLALLVTLTLVGCTHRASPGHTTSSPAPPPRTASSLAGPSAPVDVPTYLLNPAVTQDTVRTTICVVGWTSTVRPPVTYTNDVKRRQLAALGYPDQNLADYEEDHWIPLELGGAPRDERNLWPEVLPDARAKDVVESKLKRVVCDGTVSLETARRVMYLKWGPRRS